MHHHTALLIPELLDYILSFMDRNDNVINACVCKQWSEIALDLIWWKVERLLQLLALLRPYETRDASTVFDRMPDSTDWARFHKYANRVRTCRYQQKSADYSCMLDDMARTKTAHEILPNLRTLEWQFKDTRCMERATLFMHQGVRHLIISAPPLCHKDKSSFFVNICCRMPHLHSLDLRSSYAVRWIEADILQLLRDLPDLRVVTLPEFYTTSKIVSELSRKELINAIQFNHDPEQELGGEGDAGSFMPILEQGAFPALWGLDVSARLGDIIRFMSADFAPVNITNLYICTYIELEPEQLHTLLVTLSEQCRLLSELYIQLLHVPARRLKLIPAKQITFDTLRPVLSFLSLTTFHVAHKYPVNITLDEIEELASRWPSLEYLFLNEEPLVMHHFTLDLGALIPFARYCPKLLGLGLFMDASSANIPSRQELVPFTSLEVLSVGTSQARDPGAIAAFLSYMCPAGCKLEIGITWTSHVSHSCRELVNALQLEIKNRTTPWESVSDLLPLFVQSRREEREKLKALQKEVEDLKSRNRMLMDRLDIKTSDCIEMPQLTDARLVELERTSASRDILQISPVS